MPAARVVAGFFAVAGTKIEVFPMSRTGAGRPKVLTKFQPNWLELRLEKADFGKKKALFGSANLGRFCRGSAGVMSGGIAYQSNSI